MRSTASSSTRRSTSAGNNKSRARDLPRFLEVLVGLNGELVAEIFKRFPKRVLFVFVLEQSRFLSVEPIDSTESRKTLTRGNRDRLDRPKTNDQAKLQRFETLDAIVDPPGTFGSCDCRANLTDRLGSFIEDASKLVDVMEAALVKESDASAARPWSRSQPVPRPAMPLRG